MHRVGLDISALDVKFKSHALRGIGRYVQELSKYLVSNKHPDIEVGTFDHREFREQGILNKVIDYLPAGRQTIRQQLVYPFHLSNQKKKFDLLHFPAHMDAPSWSVNNYVLTVLDLIPLVLSDMYKANKATLRFTFARWLEIKAIKNAGLILAISQNTADDVHRILKIPQERIVVTPLGIDGMFFRDVSEDEKLALYEKFKIPKGNKFVIYVGGIDPRKNYVSLIESFARLLEIEKEKGNKLPSLVMAGSIKNDREYPRLRKLIEDKGISDLVIEAGYVSDMDLPALYAISSVLFFPSLYEGFGFTPLEAMAGGTPVICSPTSCMPEVLGDAAIFVDTKDYDTCALRMHEALNNPGVKEALRDKGIKRAASYNWSKTGELTLAAYEKLIAKNYVKVSKAG